MEESYIVHRQTEKEMKREREIETSSNEEEEEKKTNQKLDEREKKLRYSEYRLSVQVTASYIIQTPKS